MVVIFPSFTHCVRKASHFPTRTYKILIVHLHSSPALARLAHFLTSLWLSSNKRKKKLILMCTFLLLPRFFFFPSSFSCTFFFFLSIIELFGNHSVRNLAHSHTFSLLLALPLPIRFSLTPSSTDNNNNNNNPPLVSEHHRVEN